MCAHGNFEEGCPLCAEPPVFSRSQIAFLEDLLINKGCMQALVNGSRSCKPEECRQCAERIEDMVDQIRQMGE